MGIFTKTMYLTIVIGTLITFVGSSIGHVHADAIYDKVAPGHTHARTHTQARRCTPWCHLR